MRTSPRWGPIQYHGIRGGSSPPLAKTAGDRVLHALFGGFALWTLCVHATHALGGSLASLVALAVAALLLTAGVRYRLGSLPAQAGPAAAAEDETADPPRVWRVAALAFAAGLVGLHALGGDAVWLHAGAVALLLALAARELPSAPNPPGAARSHPLLLVALCAICVTVTLIAHRPDADDAFLLNLAVTAADAPGETLFSRDSLHGFPGPPIGVPAGLPTYRLHAIELLSGAVAWLTPLRAIDVAHLVFPVLAALLVPLAYARLFRLLTPGQWPWAMGFALAFLLAAGDSHLGYGSMGFVRLHQGKAILLTALTPLLIASALEFGLDPKPGRWLRLASLQIAALGLSASALWLAPAVSGLALICALPLNLRSARTLVWGLAASLYPVVAGVLLFAATREVIGGYALDFDPSELAERAMKHVLGRTPLASVSLLVMLAGWSLASTSLARRFTVVFPLALALAWNPLAAPWIAEFVTGESTYWRIFWLLPLPALFGLALAAPRTLPIPGAASAGTLASLALAAGALGWAPERYTLSSGNRVRLEWPGPKVPTDAYAVARALTARVEPGAAVLAPAQVSTWLPTLHHHPHPRMVRPDYLLHLRDLVSPAETGRRQALTNLVGGVARDARATSLLRHDLARKRLAAICLSETAARWSEVRSLLEDANWILVERVVGHEIWMPAPRGAS
jgi:hypothetical protein